MRRLQSALDSATTGKALAVALGLGLAASSASAQQLFQAPAPASPPAAAAPSATYDPMASARNPRAMLRNGIDFIKYKDYSRALRFLREAERRRAELDPAERRELTAAIAQVEKLTREGSVRPSPAALANANLPKRDASAVQAGAMALAANEPTPAPRGDDVQLTSNESPKLSLDAPAADPADRAAEMRVELPPSSPGPARSPAPAAPEPMPALPEPMPAPVVELPAPAPLPAPAAANPVGGPSARPEPLPDVPAPIALEPPPAFKPEEKPAPEPETRPVIGLQSIPEPTQAPTTPTNGPAPAPAPIPVEEPPATAPAPIPVDQPPVAAPDRPLPVAPLGEPTPPVAPVVEPPPAVEAEAVAPRPSATPTAVAPEVAPRPAPIPAPTPSTSSLPPDIQEEIARIASRDAEQDPRPAPPPTIPEDPALASSPDGSTRFETPRPPSSTEARPLRRIPVPEEFVPFGKREWEPTKKYWAAPATCHMPLYFQDAALERYGLSVETYMGTRGRFLTYPLDKVTQSKQRNQILQPFFSAGLFAFQIAALPYRMVVDPPWEAEYDLGYYRPGDRMPRSTTYLPWHGVGPPLQGKNY